MADAEKEQGRRDSTATTLTEPAKAQPSPEDVAAADTLKDEGNKAFAGASRPRSTWTGEDGQPHTGCR